MNLPASLRTRRLTAAILAIALPTIVNLIIVARGYDGGPYLRGDCPYYYATAISLLHDRDLDLGNQLSSDALSGNVALSHDGRIVPKHPILMPIVSAPFIAAWGAPGALVFNLSQFAVLLWLMYELAQVAGARPWSAAGAVLLTYAGSSLPHYAWNYSPDLFAAAILCAATVATARAESKVAFFWAGALSGLSVAAKYPLLLSVPGMAFLARRWTLPQAGAFAAGLVLPLVGLAWLNAHLFGAPWITSYDRILILHGGAPATIHSDRDWFTQAPLIGIVAQLVDRRHGVVSTSPATILAMVGFVSLARARPRLAVYLSTASLALVVFYSTYREWAASHYGNRFLIPVVALYVAPLGALLQTIVREQWQPRARADSAQTSPRDPVGA